MEKIDPVEVHAWKGFFNGEIEKLVNDLKLLRANFCAMVVLSGRQHLAHRLKVDQVLIVKRVQFGVELKDLFLQTIYFHLIIVNWSRAWNLFACCLLRTEELIH